MTMMMNLLENKTKGPMVGNLVNRFGCRPVCFAGGLISAAGFILSTFTGNIVLFLLTFGVLGGLGLGFNSLSGHVMVNAYFHKKRGIAVGIVSSGAGFGVFVCAPLLQYLIRMYAWKGAVLIFSGVMMQFCVCAVLMRPLKRRLQSSAEKTESLNDIESLCDHENEYNKEQSLSLLPNDSENKTVTYVDDYENVECTVLDGDMEVETTSPTNVKQGRGLNGWFLSTVSINKPVPRHFLSSLPNISISGKLSAKHCDRYEKIRLNDTNTTASGRHIPGHNHYQKYHPHHFHSQDHQIKEIHPLHRKDIFYSGSIQLLPEFQEAGSVKTFMQSMIIPTDESSVSDVSDDVESIRRHKQTKSSSLFRRCVPRKSPMCDFSVFSNSVFIPMLLGGVFIQMGQFIPSTFIPEYCATIGLEKERVSTILSIFGAVNIFGRLIAGALANVSRVSPLWVCNIGMFMCAVCCALFPLCKSYATLCVFGGGFGFFIGFFPPLQVLIMVKYLGLERLSASVGFLQMAKGPAALVGPPLAGVIYEWTQDYAMSMEFAAAMFLLSAIVQSLVPVIDRCNGNQELQVVAVKEINMSDTSSEGSSTAEM